MVPTILKITGLGRKLMERFESALENWQPNTLDTAI